MVTPNSKVMFDGALVGSGVQKTIKKQTIFRLRRSNGQYGAKDGELYQDKMAYYKPTPLTNPSGDPYRANLRAAVLHWQYALTADEKAEYNRLAGRLQHLSGYNLFLSRAIKGEIEMYVDRGDPAAYDYAKEDLTIDGAWHDLNLSAIVPAGAKAILLKTRLQSANPGDAIRYRLKGNTNEINVCGCEALRANVIRTRLGITSIDANRVIEYNADNITWTLLNIVVRGWWI